MIESEVGRTKRSAVPAGVWKLPELRCAIYAAMGDALFGNWASVQPALEKLLSDWSDPSDLSDESNNSLLEDQS
jgi:hypothetical protein